MMASASISIEHLGAHQAGDAQQGRRGPDVAERLQPGPRVVGRLREIGHEGLRVDEIAARAARLGQGPEDRLHGGAGLPVHVARPVDDAAGIEGGGAGDEHAVAHPHRARVRVLVLDGPARGDPLRRLPGAVHRVELDLDELLRPGQTAHLDQGGDRPRVPEVLRVGPGRLVGQRDVGDVDATAHHVVEAPARLAHAPLGDAHDGVDLLGHVPDAADVALPVDRRGAGLEHRVAGAQGPRVVRQLLQRSARSHVDPPIRSHGALLVGDVEVRADSTAPGRPRC